jgi:hypothetical protein
MKSILLLLTGGILSMATHAADFSLQWSTVDGGGGLSTSADGRWLLAATAGAPDAGKSDGGNFALESGFWNSVLCAYGLTITRFVDDSLPTRTTFITVSWPASELGECVLEATTELHSDPRSIVWMPVAFRRAGELNFYSTEATGRARFFRLRQ